NVAQCFALAGVGEVRGIDPDHVEPSNLTRSPLFAGLRGRSETKRFNKAKELALATLALSYADSPVVRYASSLVQGVGLGAFRGSDVIVCGVDNAGARAWIADAARLLGIPMVEAGFS